MKVGMTTSVVLHATVLGFALFSLSAPRPLEAPASESFPVDIVPVEEFAQSVAGDRRADLSERPAPIPTERPQQVEDAQNIGNNTADLATPPTPEARPRPVETAAAPPPPPPEPAPRPEPQREPEPAPPPVAAPEPAPAPPESVVEAAPEPTPAPAPEPQVAAAEPAPQQPAQQAFELPRTMPIPTERPRRQEPQQTASIPQQQRPQEQPRQQQTQPNRQQQAQQTQPNRQQQVQQQDQQFDADQIAALLNRDRPSGGGAQRSTEQASLGGRQTTGARLSQSEIDSLRSQVQRCWNPPVGAADADRLVVSIRIRLSRAGELEGTPEIVAGGGASMAERAAADAARRAVLRCQPYTAPSDKYEAWADVQFNFDPRDMF